MNRIFIPLINFNKRNAINFDRNFMIIKTTFSVLLVIVVNVIYSQVTFIDSISNSIISYVEIYSKEGVLIEISNQKGELDAMKLERLKLNNYKKFYLHQMSYKDKVITINDFLNSKEIFLSPQAYNLSEIKIKTKANKKIPYLRISGFFRGYQFSNNDVKYFIKGEVDNYLFLNKKKQKWLIKAYKSWVNVPYVEKQYSKKILVQPSPPGNVVLSRKRRTLLDIFTDKGARIEKDLGSQKYVVLDNGNKKIGGISIDTHLSLTKIYYKYLDEEDEPDTKKLFGFTVSSTYSIKYEFYKAKSLQEVKYQNLLYIKNIYYADYSSKKQKVPEKIKTIQEFFVTDIGYDTKINKTKISEYDFYKKSNYSYPFWVDIKSDLYQPLPKSVEKALETTLTELENAHTETK